jgi:hypothetical protein
MATKTNAAMSRPTVVSTALGELATVRDAGLFRGGRRPAYENLFGQPREFDAALDPRGDTLATTLDVARRGYRPRSRRPMNGSAGAAQVGGMDTDTKERLSAAAAGHEPLSRRDR